MPFTHLPLTNLLFILLLTNMLFIMPLTNLLFIMHLTNLLFVELHDGLSEVLDMRIFGDFSHDLSAIQMVR